MAYNFNKKFKTAHFTVEVDTAACYGYFEHETLGDEYGGGLWFNETYADLKGSDPRLELTDYDGVAVLPKEVATVLRENGFIVDEDFD